MGPAPLVSVIIPYYEAPEYFAETARSLAEQTYKNFEVVVVDDCSPGVAAAELLRPFSLPGLKVIRHEQNLGVQTARNTAVRNSCGELILPLDCDDVLDHDYLAVTVARLSGTELGGVYTQVELFGEASGIWIPELNLERVMCGLDGLNTFLYRRAVYDAAGGYKTGAYCSDAALWIDALSRGWQFERIERPLLRYRKRSDGRWAKLDKSTHVPNLMELFPEVYTEHLREVLVMEEQRYWDLFEKYSDVVKASEDGQSKYADHLGHCGVQYQDLVAEYRRLEDGFRSLELQYDRLKRFEPLLAIMERWSAGVRALPIMAPLRRRRGESES